MGKTWRKCMVPTCNKILPDKTWNDRYIDNKEGVFLCEKDHKYKETIISNEDYNLWLNQNNMHIYIAKEGDEYLNDQ